MHLDKRRQLANFTLLPKTSYCKFDASVFVPIRKSPRSSEGYTGKHLCNTNMKCMYSITLLCTELVSLSLSSELLIVSIPP